MLLIKCLIGNLTVLMECVLAAYLIRGMLPVWCEWWRVALAATFVLTALKTTINTALIHFWEVRKP